MASRTRKRKKRGGEFRPPPKRGQVAAERAQAEGAQATGTQPTGTQAKGAQAEGAQAGRGRPGRDARARRGGRERPPAPWGSFPLVELVVLLALVMLVAGFFVSGTQGVTMIAAGMSLGMLAGLELSIREHFAGYKSHSTVLAGFPTVVVLGIGFFVLPQGWPQAVNVVVGATVFAGAFYLLREAFKRRSGGVGFR